MQTSSGTDLQFKTIVIPVDGSPTATKAAQVAIGFGQIYAARLVVVCVVASPSYLMVNAAAPQPEMDLTQYYKKGTEDAKMAVDATVKLAQGAGLEVRGQVLEAVPSAVESIVELASSEKADLIVMGTRGLGGFKKLLLGSVSSGVLAHAPCSVLIVR